MLLLLLVLGLWSGLVQSAASISPMEIAAARQRCTTQCANPNHQEAAACMRQCWATFFAEHKHDRVIHPTAVHAAKKQHQQQKGRSAVVVVAAAAKKMTNIHPAIAKGHIQKHSSAAKKPVAPFSPLHHQVQQQKKTHHRSVRAGAVQQAVAGLGALILVICLII
jgi:hypothetical protein